MKIFLRKRSFFNDSLQAQIEFFDSELVEKALEKLDFISSSYEVESIYPF